MSYPQRNLQWITDWYFADFEDKDVINSGWCYVWAWLAKLEHRGARFYTFDDGTRAHAFIKIGSLWYDSSQPRGVRAAKSLQFFVDHEIVQTQPDMWQQDDHQFKDFWSWVPAHKTWHQQGLIAWPDRLPLRVFADDGSLMPSYHLVEQCPVLIDSALALEAGTAPA